MSQLDFIELFRLHVWRNHKTMQNYAESIGVSKAFVSKVANGHSQPTEQILESMGLEKVITYQKKRADNE